MPTLRKMIDEGVLAAGSPLATHVAKNIQDPLGETQDDFGNLAQSKMQYDLAKEQTRRKLLPVQSVLQHVGQMHQLDGILPQGADPNNPIDPDNPDMEQGLPNNMQQSPGALGPTAGKPGMAGPSQPGTGPRLTPNKVPGMSTNPNKVPGSVPGQSARPQEAVRPPKMGVPQPGQARPATVAGNPSAKPKTATGKKVGGKNGNKIKVEVNSAASLRRMPRRNSIEAGMAVVRLRSDLNRRSVNK